MNCASTASSTETGTSAPFFTGSGGSGTRLGILVPQSKGLNENQAYLPDMVQGVLVANMSKYSAISVLDRVSLDRVITETLDPTYNERANAITKIVSDIDNGLEATDRRKQWGITVSVDPIFYAYIFDFELVNERGKVISSVSTNAFLLFWDGYPLSNFSLYSSSVSLDNLLDGFHNFVETGNLAGLSESKSESPKFVVKASDITDTLSIRLKNISVYNLVQPNTGRRGILNPNNAGNNIIPVRTETF